MKVDLDARTLEAMRVVSRRDMSTDGTVQAISQAVDDIRAFLAAHDSARDAERDESLAVALAGVFYGANGKDRWRETARAARDFIAKEQS